MIKFTSQLCLLSHILQTGARTAACTNSVHVIFMYWSINVVAKLEARNNVDTWSVKGMESDALRLWFQIIVLCVLTKERLELHFFTRLVVFFHNQNSAGKQICSWKVAVNDPIFTQLSVTMIICYLPLLRENITLEQDVPFAT